MQRYYINGAIDQFRKFLGWGGGTSELTAIALLDLKSC